MGSRAGNRVARDDRLLLRLRNSVTTDQLKTDQMNWLTTVGIPQLIHTLLAFTTLRRIVNNNALERNAFALPCIYRNDWGIHAIHLGFA